MIMLLKKFKNFKNIKIGKNNYISPNSIIYDNVIIGDNNKIHDNVIIYPNTEIGNNNNIFNGNVIGEFPVASDDDYKNYDLSKSKGVIIGNNNLFHVKNIIFGGCINKTLIGNNNKFLAENHIGHDSIIKNNVTSYARVLFAGFSVCLDYSNIGSYAFIHQRTTIGQYSMIGSGGPLTKNAFPYFVNINNKITRLNWSKLNPLIMENELILREINDKILKKENIDELLKKLPIQIKTELDEYIINIKY